VNTTNAERPTNYERFVEKHAAAKRVRHTA